MAATPRRGPTPLITRSKGSPPATVLEDPSPVVPAATLAELVLPAWYHGHSMFICKKNDDFSSFFEFHHIRCHS